MNKKVVYGLIGVIIVLLAVVVGGGAYLLTSNRNNSSASSTPSGNSSSQADSRATPAQPLRTLTTSSENIQFELVSVKRQGTGILVNMRLKNVCNSCNSEYASPYDVDINLRTSYITDQTSGQKYEILKDENDKILASDGTDGQSLKKGESLSFYAQYTAPPANSVIDIYLGGIEPITGITVK